MGIGNYTKLDKKVAWPRNLESLDEGKRFGPMVFKQNGQKNEKLHSPRGLGIATFQLKVSLWLLSLWMNAQLASMFGPSSSC